MLNAASWGKKKHSRSKAQACRVFYRISEIAISCTCELASQQSIPVSLSTVFSGVFIQHKMLPSFNYDHKEKIKNRDAKIWLSNPGM